MFFDGTGEPPEEAKKVMIEFFEKRMESTVDWSVCNITDEETKAKMLLDSYTKRILLIASTFKNRDKGFVNAFFDREGEGVKLTSFNAIWPNGVTLLKTHSDAIYCGSIAVTSKDPHVLMLITAIDENCDMRMAAMGVTRSENKESWRSLFTWVKERVPQFSPNCIVTNDDIHIHSAFEESVKPKACHIVCYRRKFMASQLKTIVWAFTTEEVRKKYEEIKSFAVKSRLDEKMKGRLPIIFADKFLEAKETLPCFTGDYLCQINPVMKRLKAFILPETFDVFFTLNGVRMHRANDAI